MRAHIMEKAKHKIMNITAFKYTMIKIRSKISYIAFSKHQTIVELITQTCARSYKLFMENGIHENIYKDEEILQQYRDIINQESTLGIRTAMLMKLNV